MEKSELQFIIGIAYILMFSIFSLAILKFAAIWLKSVWIPFLCYILGLSVFWHSAILGAIGLKHFYL